MRGGLDEALARMARREEALRRRGGDPGDEARDASAATAEPTGPAEPAGRAGRAGEGRDPVREVAEAVRRVVDAHPGLSVTLRVEHDGRTYPLRIDWTETGATVGPDTPATSPPAWPVSGRTAPARAPAGDGSGDDPAARLAEMIRRDPSLLTGDR
ncbi:hypothetical protein [Micromonospora coxensis]|uniref:Uncharacterized protein n=1 Tax=Micromonospora coxensis TaxID=356852 RepID=A0A1C5IH27_9ACTN|nr:hypothetical protein [Micromonospora coxensis]SCG57574.1 hypothetical protein GA0070614_2784 [Micromonospora coxensis]